MVTFAGAIPLICRHSMALLIEVMCFSLSQTRLSTLLGLDRLTLGLIEVIVSERTLAYVAREELIAHGREHRREVGC